MLLIFTLIFSFDSNYDSYYSSSTHIHVKKTKQFSQEEFYNSYQLNFLNESELEYLDVIGSGRFSSVKRVIMPDKSIAAAKKLVPTEEWRVKKEVKIMEQLKGQPHIISLIGVYGDEYDPVIVTNYLQSDSNCIPSYQDLKWVMKSLLQALNSTHYNKIFHRDVKWQNMIVSFKDHKLFLIDWGLADYIVKGRSYSPKTGTKSYKAPELLLSYNYYNQKVDIWAAGCVMANLMFGVHSFFSGHDNEDVLLRQVEFYGKLRMKRLAMRYGKKKKFPYLNRQSFLEYALPHTRHLITRESLDFLSELLYPEPEYRPNAADALLNPFFNNTYEY
ncbi:hypothetical protein M9Y10_044804 [Tritrichomonas musculus]|uniref:non-specific serine/threonine protein kinase n=1 Tax=Tritrichomonas musculus TaxID=1915356 RepID=A0ABR2JTF1_9EUKA